MPQVSATQAPPEIVARLREIDPAAALLHLGGRSWWLGVIKPNNPARERLQKMLENTAEAASLVEIADPVERALVLERVAKEHLMYQIMAQGPNGEGGFRPIELREIATLQEFHELVDDFRRADWEFRNLGMNGLQRAFFKARDTGRQFAERVRQDARSLWTHFMSRRGATILNPWGRSAPTTQEDN